MNTQFGMRCYRDIAHCPYREKPGVVEVPGLGRVSSSKFFVADTPEELTRIEELKREGKSNYEIIKTLGGSSDNYIEITSNRPARMNVNRDVEALANQAKSSKGLSLLG